MGADWKGNEHHLYLIYQNQVTEFILSSVASMWGSTEAAAFFPPTVAESSQLATPF